MSHQQHQQNQHPFNPNQYNQFYQGQPQQQHQSYTSIPGQVPYQAGQPGQQPAFQPQQQTSPKINTGGDPFQFYQQPNPNQPLNPSPSMTFGSPGMGQPGNMMYQVPVEISYLAAFSTGGLPNEQSLLEELGINVWHIWQKTFTVLNPMKPIDQDVMDDTDLWGPFLFCMAFGAFLLLSGKVHFSYIYGVAMLGWLSIYGILNLMSENGADMYRTASVLGYCLLPMVILSSVSILLRLQGVIGYGLGIASILWCTYSSSSIFVTILGMKNQRILVAYPVGLLYACFALITIF